MYALNLYLCVGKQIASESLKNQIGSGEYLTTVLLCLAKNDGSLY